MIGLNDNELSEIVGGGTLATAGQGVHHTDITPYMNAIGGAIGQALQDAAWAYLFSRAI